ncbi:PilZ domain-containing protein [Caenimonas sedimenti]|uniref:PilZ domain-containing protein n=1 Tax=Caenimonas sedimenti TaxID=2596921 RepID=A0A562ZUA5_9BURK|nr:PilZ domain-containing protein [Caenimonas sedimenti]TWO71918.1 PilZ domain-containing protein [Caenimonas sedimenti]
MPSAQASPRIPIWLPINRREAGRVAAEMPLRVDGHPMTTLDISASGIAFESDKAYALGERVSVVVEYMLDGANFPLRCEAEVMRVEPNGTGYSVGARLILEPGQDGRVLRPET